MAPTDRLGALDRDVRRAWSRDMLRGLVTQRHEVEAGKKILSPAHQHRRNREMHLVDQPLGQVLPDGRHAAANPNVLSASGLAGALQSRLNALRDKMECRAAGHDKRAA